MAAASSEVGPGHGESAVAAHKRRGRKPQARIIPIAIPNPILLPAAALLMLLPPLLAFLMLRKYKYYVAR